MKKPAQNSPRPVDTPDSSKPVKKDRWIYRYPSIAEWVDVGFLRHRWTNDGEISDGVFRSNNPDEKRYRKYADRGIKTVVNLRNDVNRWPVRLAHERVERNGMTYVSYPMAARQAPTKDVLLGLLQLFPSLDKPVLFHCKSGADRTGLVAAIWRMVMDAHSLSDAREELSLKYLHRWDSETGALDQVLDAYAPFEGSKSFESWVREDYDPDAAEAAAAAAHPNRSFWAEARAMWRDLYRYAQFREARWHASFAKPIETPEDQSRANTFIKWVDHGVLRGVWTNFYQIGDGVWRSNHPTERRFRNYASQGFKTIVNLRGASMQPQYQLEKKLCAELGFTLIDLQLKATEAPSRENALALLDIFDQAERPMIIHCKSGADRTSMAAALYKLHVGEGVKAARKQFSLRYIHLKNSPKGVLDKVLDAYEADTAKRPMPVREWIETHYQPDAITKAFRDSRKG